MSLSKQEIGKILKQKFHDPSLSVLHTHFQRINTGGRNRVYRCQTRYQGTSPQRGTEALILKFYDQKVNTRDHKDVNAIWIEGKILETFNRQRNLDNEKLSCFPAPRLYLIDYSKNLVVMEERGEKNLTISLQEGSESEQLQLYQKILKGILKIHIEGTRLLPSLNYQHPSSTEWYQLSFLEKRLSSNAYQENLYSPQEIQELKRLSQELHQITQRQKIHFLHGDLNPENILISEGQPFFIDWELARLGHAPLDILDFLNRHPQQSLSQAYRKELWNFYLFHLKKDYYLDFIPEDQAILWDIYNLLSNFVTITSKSQAILKLKLESTNPQARNWVSHFEKQILKAFSNLEQGISNDPRIHALSELTNPYLKLFLKLCQNTPFKNSPLLSNLKK